jgi:prepilin-type N-terminal cleavage/methylation domain-containing protein
MTGAPPRQRGLTLLELAIVLVVASVAGTAFLERLHRYQELAEKAAMEYTMSLIKTGLQIRLAELIIGNRQGEAAQLEQEDPTQWLDPRPTNYAGDYRQTPEPGKWYFDARQKQLVYVVQSGDRLELDAGQTAKELRFQARLLRDRIKVGAATVDSVTSITLAPVYPYRWSGRSQGSILAKLSQVYQRDANDLS